MSLDLFLHAVEVGVFVEHAVHAALGAGAIVAGDVEDEGVVELADLADGIDQAADVVVGVIDEGGECFDLAEEEALLVGGEGVPILDGVRLGSEFGALRHDAQGNLPGQGFLADFVPALVEFALPFGDPFGRRVVRGVGRAGGEIDEKRLVRGHCLLEFHPGDRLVGHVVHEVVIGIGGQFDLGGAVVKVGSPLVGLAAEEAVEMIEALAGRPAVRRARRR